MIRLDDIGEKLKNSNSYSNHNQSYTFKYRQLQVTKLLFT